jgi:hypothetical protein
MAAYPVLAFNPREGLRSSQFCPYSPVVMFELTEGAGLAICLDWGVDISRIPLLYQCNALLSAPGRCVSGLYI